MNVALIGFAVENQAALKFFQSKGDKVTIHDLNTEISVPDGIDSVLGESYLDDLNRYDLIVRTVGMHPQLIIDKNPYIKEKITTAIDIFFQECKTPIIGVTGTKGKGTTSTLIYQIIKASGKSAVLAGNIGVPALEVLDEANNSDYVVLELSSFQLYDVKHSPHVAVCLMIVPEHLDWHSDFNDYKSAKKRLFEFQNSEDVAIFNGANESSIEIASSSPAINRISYSTDQSIPSDVYIKDEAIYFNNNKVCEISEVQLVGRHNLENISAAIAATWDITNGNIQAMKSVISSFTGLEYRIEFIREIDGVKYYNDSFSTTPETAIAAIRSFKQPKIVILGGSDKGVPFDELAKEVVENNVKHVLAIGVTGQIIASLLQNLGYTDFTTSGLDTMDQIVKKAKSLSSEGDVVLLSTGSASFDMFKNYKDRGDQFNLAVRAL